MKFEQDIGETFIKDLKICDEFIDYFENYKGGKRVTGSQKSCKAHSLNTPIQEKEKIRGRNCVDLTVNLDCVDKETFDLFEPFLFTLRSKFHEYEKKVNIHPWPVILLENFNIQKYIPPFGVYSQLHYEHNYDAELYFRRIYVWCLYLNTVEEGGETFFPKQKYKVKAERGKLSFFPAFFTHPHKGIKASTTKYIMTGWLSAVLTGETPQEIYYAHKNMRLLDRPKTYFNSTRGNLIV